jgi:hypothetical protein
MSSVELSTALALRLSRSFAIAGRVILPHSHSSRFR